MQEIGCDFGGRRRWLLTALALSLHLSLAKAQVIPGEPPAFPSTDDPRDQFVFERDAEDNPVALEFSCPVTGSGPPVINWFRKVGDSFTEDNVYRQEDGSYLFPNITEANSAFANGDGIEYYCTATNDFGTIRSRTVRAFYADFKGFAIDGELVDPEADPVPRTVDVIIADAAINLQWVSLECEVMPGSTPTPDIQWIRTDTGGGNPEVLIEDFMSSTVRFIDGGQWLILETTMAAVSGKEYYCQVTNKQRFQTMRGPITYTLNPVTRFPDEPDGIKIYKPLISRTVPRLVDPGDVDATASSPYRVAFGVGIAYNGTEEFTQNWRINGRLTTRSLAGGPVVSILPYLIPTDNDDPVLKIELLTDPDVEEDEEVLLSATLTLQAPAFIMVPIANVDDGLNGETRTFTCLSGGSNREISFYFNGVKLEEGVSGDTLIIPSTTTANTGVYQCIVENDSGSDGTSWYLIVRDPIPPAIVTSYAVGPDPCLGFPFIQQEDPPVLLSVNITADPCPTAVWTKDGGDLPASGVTVTDGCGSFMLGDKFVIFSLSVDEFTDDTLGTYALTVTSKDGGTTEEVPEIRVTNRVRALITSLITDPDSPIGTTDTGCLSAGATVKFICDYIAFPVATLVEFSRDGTVVDPTVDDRFTQECNVLTITGVTPEDEGTYICRVQNDPDPQYEDVSEPLKLDYCIKPSIEGQLTFTRKNPDEGERTTASCEWTGSPDPVVTWSKDGSPLREEDLPARIRITMAREGDMFQSGLEIDAVELSDTADYACNVSNPVGSAYRFKRLEVQGVDEPVLSEIAIIGVAAGGAGLIVLVAVVLVLLCCVWTCARKCSTGSYSVPPAKFEMAIVGGEYPDAGNVDAPDGLDEPEEPFNPDYASLPALRPAQPPQYKPTPNYPSDMPPADEYQKRVPSEEDFVGPYGHDNGGMHHHQPYQPTVDDFVSDDAQFV